MGTPAVRGTFDGYLRGFTFVGPMVMYSHMQAVGLVNDHVAGCFRRKEIEARRPRARLPKRK